MHQRFVVGDELAAHLDEPVLDAANDALVAGDGAGREDHQVAVLEPDVGMLVLGDAGERRARLALAARAEDDDLLGRDVGEVLLVVVAEVRRQIARLLRHLDHAVHGTARHDDLAPRGAGGFGHGLDARDVGGEDRHGHAALGATNDGLQVLRDLALGRRSAIAHGVGAVAHHRQDALLAQRLQARLVDGIADEGRVVDLPVAGVQDVAECRAQDERVGLGDRVRDGDEFEVERPHGEAAVERDLVDLDVLGRPILGELGLQKGGRERGGVERRPQARPEFRDGAEVVLVRVGEHDTGEARAFFGDEAHVGQDHVDAGIELPLWKGDAEVDHEPRAAVFRADAVKVAVHADLADAAERQEDQLFSGDRL